MNREKYHFQIPAEERENFRSTVKKLTGEDISWAAFHDFPEGKNYSYLVDLSKYELLYLRLAVKSGTYVNMSSTQEDQSDNTRTQMA